MKNFKFYIVIFFILFLLIESLCFFVVDIKLKKMEARLPPRIEMDHKAVKDYIKYLPYLRERSFLNEFKHSAFDNNYYIYDIINEYNNKNNENILIQGDSEALILSENPIHSYLKNYAEKNKIGIFNAGQSSYSISPMTVQLDIFENEFKIKPSIIIAIIDQTDVGDELFRYKNTDNDTFSLNLSTFDKKFQLKEIENLKRFNSSAYKLAKYLFNYFNYFKNRTNLTSFETINYMIDKNKSKFYNIPEVFYPLKRGLNSNEKEIFVKRVNTYINIAFQNDNLKKIYFVTHPHPEHLENNKKFISNVSTIIDDAISKSKFKEQLIHVNFSKNNKNVNIESFVKLDKFSHLTQSAYLNYYLPTILDKIEINNN